MAEPGNSPDQLRAVLWLWSDWARTRGGPAVSHEADGAVGCGERVGVGKGFGGAAPHPRRSEGARLVDARGLGGGQAAGCPPRSAGVDHQMKFCSIWGGPLRLPQCPSRRHPLSGGGVDMGYRGYRRVWATVPFFSLVELAGGLCPRRIPQALRGGATRLFQSP